ncbi:fimbrial protein [Providencia vermicola]|uniref:fimbrial protein n=1 Tax=Providencia vermicola TaxID=333965 RepID=UPI003D27331E
MGNPKRHTGVIRALWLPGILGMMVCGLSVAHAELPSHPVAKNWNSVNNWDVDGAHGVLYVHGALTESACRLEMSSAYQDIDLHEIGTGRLRTMGAAGTPVSFELRLADCLDTGVGLRDVRTGAQMTTIGQPAVRVSFRGVRDTDTPQWVKANGVTGIGLRLLDARGEDVRLGDRGQPLQLTPGENTLHYTVTPMRTAAPLNAGAYHAVVDFYLSYE